MFARSLELDKTNHVANLVILVKESCVQNPITTCALSKFSLHKHVHD